MKLAKAVNRISIGALHDVALIAFGIVDWVMVSLLVYVAYKTGRGPTFADSIFLSMVALGVEVTSVVLPANFLTGMGLILCLFASICEMGNLMVTKTEVLIPVVAMIVYMFLRLGTYFVE